MGYETKQNMKNEGEREHNLPTEDEVEAEAQSGTTFFGRIFKIARCERSLFTYICMIFFFVSYIYSISRDMKDAIVIERLDPASIPYLKMLVVLPTNVILVFIIQKILVNTSVPRVFSAACLIFGIYFCLYGVLLMSFRDSIELSEFFTRDWFSDDKMVFKGLQWTVAIVLTVNSWTSSLLYLSAEIWGTVVLQFLFFCFSNEIYTQRQSLRFTPLFLVFGNIALITSGFSMKLVKHISERCSYEFTTFFRKLIFVILGSCSFLIYGMHRYFEDNIAHKPLFTSSERAKIEPKQKIGFREGMQTIVTSKLVIAISLMVFAYSVSVSMVESSFKTCMNQYAIYKGFKVDFHVMDTQSDIQLAVGSLAVVLLVSPFPTLIRRKGFSYVAFAPPLFCLVGMACVFGAAALNVAVRNDRPLFGVVLPNIQENLWLEQLFGVIAVTGFKLLKYSALDISKEALSMKINPMYRARFKGIYDGICGKFGKAAGSGITSLQTMFYNSNDVREAAVSSFAIVILINGCWIASVNYLSSKYDKSVQSNTDIDIDIISGKRIE